MLIHCKKEDILFISNQEYLELDGNFTETVWGETEGETEEGKGGKYKDLGGVGLWL